MIRDTPLCSEVCRKANADRRVRRGVHGRFRGLLSVCQGSLTREKIG